MSDYYDKVNNVIDELRNLLKTKSEEYGDSVFIPMNIFTRHVEVDNHSLNSILYRLDDKLSRIKNNKKIREDDVKDLIGYLLLLMVYLKDNV